MIANDHISFELKKGEIHAILGENGAGKTTLMNIIYGLYQPDEGEIRINGKKVSIKSPKDAINLGIGMVHQHFTLVPTMTALDNIILGREPVKGPMLDRKKARKDIIELAKKFKLSIDLDAKIWQMSVGEKQKVEILKALYRGAKILIMDEPTSSLTPPEKEELMLYLKEISKMGIATIPFITHKLPEVMAISNRVTILRKGKLVGTIKTKDATSKILATKMVGREVIFKIKREKSKLGEKILEVSELKAKGDKGEIALKGVSFDVKRGEIFGIAGVAGNGQRELAEVLVSLRRSTGGKVFWNGKDSTNVPLRKVANVKIGYIPENRMEDGVIADFTVAENMILGLHKQPQFSYKWWLPFDKKWFINSKSVNEHSEQLVKDFSVATPDVFKHAGKLSGGNIQKIILARELSNDPDFILANRPTAGLDVGSQEYVYNVLMEAKKNGKAILLISEDLDEILSLSDRIAVIYEGNIRGIFDSAKANKEKIGLLMAGR